MVDGFDIAIVGGGIAGLSVAAELAPASRVVVLEAEDQPGYHATGRSAAIFAQNYGTPLVRALTAWSAGAYRTMGDGVLSERGLVRVAQPSQRDSLVRLYRDMTRDWPLTWLEAAEVEARVPLLRRGWASCGFVNEDAADMDVAAIMKTLANRITSSGSEILTGFRVAGIAKGPQGWTVRTRKDHQVTAQIVVNAAGAWADEVAALAGTSPVGVVPKRRSAVSLDAPAGFKASAMPMVVDADETFFLKPEGGALMASPCDETPALPGDSRPEEIDIAVCIDRIESAFDVSISRPRSTWAGLRTFVSDGNPVCGWDRQFPDFFWLAGQGGFGVQTAPALARLAADMLLGRGGAAVTAMKGVDPRRLSPHRFNSECSIYEEQGELT